MIRDVAAYESRRRLRGSIYLGIGLALYALLYAAFFPSVKASGAQLEEYIRNLPPALRAAFGIENITTIEGFLASQLYQFVWVLILMAYLAYRAAGAVAGDVESGRMDLVLAAPVGRASVVVGKWTSFLVPIAVLNVFGGGAVYAAVVLAGETIAVDRLLVVHLLSVPFLLTAVGIGLLVSVAVRRQDLAQRGALAVTFGLYLVDNLTTTDPDLEWIGLVSPTRYYDPTAIMVRASYDWAGAGLLLAVAVLLLVASALFFRRVDVV